MPPDRPRPGHAVAKLSLLEVVKDLFTSEWYARSADLLFEGEGERAALRRIAEESDWEWRATLDVLEAWSQEEGADEGAERVARIARRDFLRLLVDAKEDAWHAYEVAALVAPLHHTERLMELARRDLEHASTLRAMLQEVDREG